MESFYVRVNLKFTVVLSLVVKSIRSNCECSENEIAALIYTVFTYNTELFTVTDI